MESATQQEELGVNSPPPIKPAEQKASKRKFYFISFAVLFVILLALLAFYVLVFKNPFMTSIKTEDNTMSGSLAGKINDGEIVFENLGQLYLLDTANMEKNLLPISDLKPISKNETDGNKTPNGLSLSRDGRYLFFDYNSKLYIYDFKTKAYKSFDVGPGPYVATENISPDNRVIVIDTRTGPGQGGKVLFDLLNSKILYSTFASHVVWSPNGMRFAYDQDEVEWWNLALGPNPANKSIYMGDITNGTGSAKLILKGTTDVDYGVEKWLDNDNLVVVKNAFSEPIPRVSVNGQVDVSDEYQQRWMKIWENPTKTYWKYNVLTGRQEEIKNYIPEKKELDTYSYSPNKLWKVIIEGDWPNKVIYAEKAENLEKIKIGSGSSAIWLR